MTVIIGNLPYYLIHINEVPVVNDTINLKRFLSGSFRVTAVGTVVTREFKNVYPNIQVERVGDHEVNKPIYDTGQIAI